MKLCDQILYVLSLIISTNCVAAIGTITEQVDNPASIQRQKTMLNGIKGTGVEMEDAVKTTKGKVGITFADNTRVQVNENSKLVIDDFVYDPKNKDAGKLALKMASGTVRYASGAIAKNNPAKVAINTPTATIAVRGTDFTATVDELGASTIILLPSCPDDRKNRTVEDIEANCVTGSIIVETDLGHVVLNQPFQATRVESRGTNPAKPVTLKLAEGAISNLLIVSPPQEIKQELESKTNTTQGALDIDYLKETGLVNALDIEQKEIYSNKLDRNFLDTDFLTNILDIVNAQLAAQLDLLGKTKSGLLPDYVALSGITVEVDEPKVTLCRDNGSDIQCVTTPTTQNSTIYQTQGVIEFKNRVNSGTGTTITLIQK